MMDDEICPSSNSVGSIFTMTSLAPLRFAKSGSGLAGDTCKEEPKTINNSAILFVLNENQAVRFLSTCQHL
jgi:hypothetical protein